MYSILSSKISVRVRYSYLIFFSLVFSSCRFQEKMLFAPDKLAANYKYSFEYKFEEMFFTVDENTNLNGLLFRKDSAKGLIFYLHGNGGALDSWGNIAGYYLKNNYDFFILDYRGYGKSEGQISSETQIYRDIQLVYDSLKSMYAENSIIVIGYSIGTGFAAQLASVNSPKLLVLKAPYYCMVDLAHQYIKVFPSFIMRYKILTHEYISKVVCPVIIFHGDEDEVIYYGSSEKLQKHFKLSDRLIKLTNQKHNGINNNAQYQQEMSRILNSL